jgi:protein phosphatase 4 regulatory subunit 3
MAFLGNKPTDRPFLSLAVIRFYRACLRVNNHFMFRYLNKGDVFAPVLDLVSAESAKDNMLSSACLELFEYIRRVSPCASARSSDDVLC